MPYFCAFGFEVASGAFSEASFFFELALASGTGLLSAAEGALPVNE